MYVSQRIVAWARVNLGKLAASQFRNSNSGLAGAVEVIFGFFGYQCFRMPELAADLLLVELGDMRTQRLINLRGGASAGGADVWPTHILAPANRKRRGS